MSVLNLIEANAGDLENGGGGPFWYAASAASGADTVELSAVPLEGDQVQNVTLVWADYDRLQRDLASQNQ
ncbi:hypothetical protein BO79DRAFT_271239 [Aspergillus costaricaensis CBS 115574]|uniref:Uncharacterized protein n=1 Tax=Aspergillus costaricaensis CBS 115574 TaxID=1448317 RepID=A0ACD1I8H9_9EURO|nr:hypothetical protein BO79DRAFT_271239 [Aspergillus costaricaensis CBS 115574]RAK86073.1 hypothetical protein BO79DRAFT_271239 [Aspergillus costaricaensis CBS 115574]